MESTDSSDQDRGWPACLQVPRWYEDNEHLSKREALDLINRIRQVMSTQQARATTLPRYTQRISGLLTTVPGAESGGSERGGSEPSTEQMSLVRVFKPGSIVAARSGQQVTVRDAVLAPDGKTIVYQVEISGRTLSVPGSVGNLTPVQVEEEVWCLGCGAQGLGVEESVCPLCGNRALVNWG